jgi:hypothetical protein
MSARIDQLTTVVPAAGDRYVIYDASTGDVAAAEVTVPMSAATESTAGVGGTVPAPAAGKSGRVLTSDNEWLDPRGGVNIASATAKRLFGSMILVGASSDQQIEATKLPFIFDSVDDARIAAGWMVSELVKFFKNLENDTTYDQLINMFVNVGSKVGGAGIVPLTSGQDMDNQFYSYDESAANQTLHSGNTTEWFEVIVGRNRAGDKYYTFWFLPYHLWVTNALSQQRNTYSFRMYYQMSVDEDFATKPVFRYFNNVSPTPALASNQRDFSSSVASGLPQLTTRDTNTKVKSGTNSNVPIWFEPITLELSR